MGWWVPEWVWIKEAAPRQTQNRAHQKLKLRSFCHVLSEVRSRLVKAWNRILLLGGGKSSPLVLCVCSVASVRSNSLRPPWTVAHQAPLYMEFSRQEYWGGLPWPPPRDLPGPETEPSSPALAGSSLPLVPPKKSVELSKLFKLVTKLSLLPYFNQRWTCVELQKDISASWLLLLSILKADNSYKADLVIRSRGDPESVS